MVFILLLIFIFAQTLWGTAYSAEQPNHIYTAEYENTMSTYDRHVASIYANDKFNLKDINISNSFNFKYSANSKEAPVDQYVRLSELFLLTTENYRFSAHLSSPFFKGGSFADNFQYTAMAERKIRLSHSSYFDVGLGVTNVIVYNRIYPAPLPFPVLSWTYAQPDWYVRLGLPIAVVVRKPRIEFGFSWLLMFNSKLYVKWFALPMLDVEFAASTGTFQLVVGDPKRDRVINVFQSNFMLQSTARFWNHAGFTLGIGYEAPQLSWFGDPWRIFKGSTDKPAGGSYVVKAAVSYYL